MSKANTTYIAMGPTWGKTLSLFEQHGYIKMDTPSSEQFKKILDAAGYGYETEQLEGNLTRIAFKKKE